MKFYNFKEEDYIKDWMEEQLKNFVKKYIEVIITGFKLFLAFLPIQMLLTYYTGFYVKVECIPLVILSFGLIWDALENMHEKRIEGRIRANLALPKLVVKED